MSHSKKAVPYHFPLPPGFVSARWGDFHFVWNLSSLEEVKARLFLITKMLYLGLLYLDLQALLRFIIIIIQTACFTPYDTLQTPDLTIGKKEA